MLLVVDKRENCGRMHSERVKMGALEGRRRRQEKRQEEGRERGNCRREGYSLWKGPTAKSFSKAFLF